MGNPAAAETLALRWAQVCRDASLRNLPYKIELNAWGKIEMSPANNRRVRLQGAKEVWVVDESGAIRYFDAGGEKPASGYPVSVSLPEPLAP